MTMRTYNKAVLLVLAMVMAVLSTGICTVPAPAPSLEEFPTTTENTCVKILADSGCVRNHKACHDNCFIKLKGNGVCLRDACWCSYTCKPSLLSPPPAAQ
ncbi:hypothetical protein ZEAMMB73_Zm00001d052117 [Zea mays]|uniref:Uncharacterized protein n=1 Tax=Zea mays TaxID=4577 RepID=A0A1D6QDL7_MAIZE|nr:hypothetical protein ZEAMMB73_Zm00001d052117 [Zea mays]